VSVIDNAKPSSTSCARSWAASERAKLDLHLEALREVERRVKPMGGTPHRHRARAPLDLERLHEASSTTRRSSRHILRAQIDLMVQAMACGLTKVGAAGVACTRASSS
jgi:hypothetical protein